MYWLYKFKILGIKISTLDNWLNTQNIKYLRLALDLCFLEERKYILKHCKKDKKLEEILLLALDDPSECVYKEAKEYFEMKGYISQEEKTKILEREKYWEENHRLRRNRKAFFEKRRRNTIDNNTSLKLYKRSLTDVFEEQKSHNNLPNSVL